MSGVTFRQVSKRFGSVVALSALDLQIEPGEFVALLGPSGSGKTTTLNLLAGLLPCDQGEILIGDRLVNNLSADRRNVAMVFQNYALYPHMTVFENIAFPLRARGRRQPEPAIRAKVTAAAEQLGIDVLLARYPKELSGGQQQRVALGRAMVREPQVFLLDEPLSNLDARLRIRMRHDIKALHQQLQSTIVYVTHDQAEAMTLSSRIAVFSLGELQQFASPSEIYNRPANTFVANFVGDREINLFPAVVEASDGRLLARSGGQSMETGFSVREISPPADGSVIVGIRPEGVTPDPAPGARGIAARVTQTELIGPDLIVYASAEGLGELCCRARPDLAFAPNDLVTLRVDPAHLHLFDPATTLAIRPAA